MPTRDRGRRAGRGLHRRGRPRTARSIETDLAASQAIFGQSPLGFLLFDTDLRMQPRQRAVRHRLRRHRRGPPRPRRPTTTCPRSRPTGSTARCARCWRPATPSRTCTLVGTVPGVRRAPPLVHQPLPAAQRHRPPHRRRRARHRRHRAPRAPSARPPAPAATSPCSTRPVPGSATPSTWRPPPANSSTSPSRSFCDLASVDLYQGLLAGDETPPGPADGSGELRRVAFASAVSDAPVIVGAVPATARSPVGAVHRYPVQLALRGRPAHRASPQLTVARPSTAASSSRRSPCRWSPTTPSSAWCSSPGRRAASRSASGTSRWPVELAARAAVCIDNARLYRREHERALILQRSLLPAGRPGGGRARHRLPLPARQHGDRGRRRLVRRHRTARPPHGAGRRRRDGPRPARRGRDGRTAHRGPDAGPARPRTGRGALRAGRDRPRPRRARRRPAGHPRGPPAPRAPTCPRCTSPPACTPSTTR